MADTVHIDVCPDCGTASTGHGMDPPGHCPHPYELRVPVLYMPAEVTHEMVEAGARASWRFRLDPDERDDASMAWENPDVQACYGVSFREETAAVLRDALNAGASREEDAK